jgi:PAS domain S-box-containing protein
MFGKSGHPGQNALIAELPAESRVRTLGNATTVTLEAGQVVCDAEQPIQYVYFPVTCALSILSMTTQKLGVETAAVGFEGMAPIGAFHNVDVTSEQVIAHVPGTALRLSVDAFHAAVAETPALRARLHRFGQALFTFASQSSACNRQHSVVQRCARWMLTTHDRVRDDDFDLTHLFLSQMLGVRRSSVTVAAEVLRAGGAIAYSRGRLRVENREELERRSCECYGIIRSAYDRLLAGVNTPSPLASIRLSDGVRSLVGGGLAGDSVPPNANDGAPTVAHSLAEFRNRLHGARERREALQQDAVGNAASSPAKSQRLLNELSIALEELQVAEEEMRTQMEALDEMRLALESQQQLWRARFDGLPDAFVETDGHDSIVEVNHAAEELLARPRASLIGKPLATLFGEEDRRQMREVISQLRRGVPSARWTGHVMTRSAESGPSVSVAGAASASGRSTAEKYSGARWLIRRSTQS